MCLRECEEWVDGEGFYLGATQLEITHQITLYYDQSRGKRLHVSFSFTGNIVNLFLLHGGEERRADGGVIAQWAYSAEQQMSPNSQRNTCLAVMTIY